MELSITLQQKIIDFLTSYLNLHDYKVKRKLVYDVDLDQQLQQQIYFLDEVPAKFAPLLVGTFSQYGMLSNGRNPLEVLLEITRKYIKPDAQAHCDTLIEELSRRTKIFLYFACYQ